MSRSAPLLLFPAALSGLLAAALVAPLAATFADPSPAELARIVRASRLEGERVAALEDLSRRADAKETLVEVLKDPDVEALARRLLGR